MPKPIKQKTRQEKKVLQIIQSKFAAISEVQHHLNNNKKKTTV